MNRYMRCWFAAAMVLVALGSPMHGSGQTPTPAPCVLGYTVGLFNGVFNSYAAATISLNILHQSVQEATQQTTDTYNNEDVGYQLFYNHTGNNGGPSWQDLAETFQQRQNELDPTGYFSQQHFYVVWEQVTGGGEVFDGTLAGASTVFSNFVDAAATEAGSEIIAALSYSLSNPPTASDYAAQNAELDTLAGAGRKLMLVAHSQGNLFLNLGYDHVMPSVGATRVKAIHVAPASPTIRGQYILSSNDVIINGLRANGGATTVQPNNIVIPVGAADLSGHTFADTYMVPGTVDGTRSNGRNQVEVLETGALSALTAPSGCPVTVTPSTNTLQAGQSVQLTAKVNPVPTDPALTTAYSWAIAGNAGGTFAGGATTATTAVPTITYTLPASATAQTSDQVTAKVLEEATPGDATNAVSLGTGTAVVTVAPTVANYTPWLGVWTCTRYSTTPGSADYTATFTPAAQPNKTTNLDVVEYTKSTNSTGYFSLYGTATMAVFPSMIGSANPNPLFTFTGGGTGYLKTYSDTAKNVYHDACTK